MPKPPSPIIKTYLHSWLIATNIPLLPGMLLTYETRDCICLLQEDPLFDIHPSSICQSFSLQGVLVFEPTKIKMHL